MNYFIHDERDLSPAYVRKCKKFFKELKEPDAWIRRKLQASSSGLSMQGDRGKPTDCFTRT
jgi:hypothetical protein